MRKTLAAVSFTVMASLCINSFSVFAADTNAVQPKSVRGNQISEEFEEYLEEFDIDINANTTFELAPTVGNARTASGNALVITNTDGYTTKKNVMLFVDEDGSVGLDSLASITSLKGETYPTGSWEKRLTITGTAFYNRLDGLDIQPQAAQFRYKKNQECDVSDIEFLFLTYGYEHSILDNTRLLDDPIEFYISVSEDNPTPTVVYYKSRPFPSNIYMHLGTGEAGMIGAFMTFSWTVDGKTLGQSLQII